MYKFYLDGLELPITPSKLSINAKNNNKLVMLINEGEVNILKTPGLSEISFEFCAPAQNYPFQASKARGRNYYLEKIEKLKASKRPFNFIVSRAMAGKITWDTSLSVSLEDYEIVENQEEGLDVIIRVQLRQYRAIGNRAAYIRLNEISFLGRPRQRNCMGSMCGSSGYG